LTLEDWATVTLGEISSLITSGSRGWGAFYSECGNPFIRMTNLSREGIRLDLSDLRFVRLPEDSSEGQRTSISKGDILISITAELGRIGFVNFSPEKPAYVNQHVCLVRPDADAITPEFLALFLAAAPQRVLFNRLNDSGAKAGLNLQTIRDFPVRFPPLPEQRKIAEILRTWDEALEKLTALRTAKERRLGALRAALLFGSLRLKDLRHNWAPTRLEAVTHELTKRNGAKCLGRERVMGVTKAEGVVPMREQTIAADISRYKRLPPRAFAYNPMRINVGSIAMNERDEAVLVSPDYVVFACNADGLDPDYLDHLRKTSWWAHYINSGGSGSVRQRTYYDDLAALKLPLPELDEQKAIAAVLNTARDDLAATEREIEAVTRQKRGLMQKLLTGEWRVKLEEPIA
jgi:type I restriction enzyme S subunit